ncbi:Fc receptor-like protein 5 isoform X2 [Meles meles]|uniref:Fc receptor-like protein 5 isoform X2 n=1 Tax=Meles meles TaxID=9662 RepID=UPI001E69DA0F|nr:Fc receptor-like protein 5 isoform X2 [Meles meles]
MLLWVSVLVLAPVSGQFAPISKPVISLHPPWTVTFNGEAVTLTCHVAEDKKWYRWYLGAKILREIPANTLQVQESGEYKCEIHGLPQSDAVSLTFSPGDPLTLTCREKPDLSLKTRTLYKNDNKLIDLGKNSSFHIKHAGLKDNGEYRCTGFGTHCAFSSNAVRIQVQELFPRPRLRANPSSPTPGEPVILTCETQLPPQKSDVQLQFQFFRDDRRLGSGWKGSLRTSIPSITGNEDPPYYWCEATAVPSGGSKSSQKLQLPARIPVSPPVLTLSPPSTQAVEGEWLTLSCEAKTGSYPIEYQFLHEEVVLRKTKVTFRETATFQLYLKAEHSGTYFCTADNGLGIRRSQPVSLSVTVPVSRPVLTLSPPGPRAVEGDWLMLSCQAQRGSPSILYQFYHGNVPLGSSSAPSAGGASFSVALTAEHSGTYFCTADNGFGPQRSDPKSLSVTVPASRPVLTLRAPGTRAVVGDVVEFHCEAQRGSPPILYRFYHEDVILGNSWAPSGGGVSFNLSLTAEHSGNYACEADNGLGSQRSEETSLSVTVPASHPILTLRAPRAPAVVGDMVELRCEAQSGSPPILYRFYHEDVTLGSNSATTGGGASFNLSLTAEHSGNYACEADNGLGAQRSKMVPLSVTVPASRPVLTLRAPGPQAVVGDMVELHCEAQSGSPPILYRFYHEDIILGSSSAASGGGASFNLSLTAERSGNYSCEADNGLGAQRSEVVTLSITGLTGSRSGPIATGVAGGLLSVVGLVVVALLLYCRLPRRAGGRPTSDPSRSPSDTDPQEPTYYNVPGWMELQPVYSNVNPKGGDVVYSEVRIQEGNRHAAASHSTFRLLQTHLPCHGPATSQQPSSRPQHSSVIYSQWDLLRTSSADPLPQTPVLPANTCPPHGHLPPVNTCHPHGHLSPSVDTCPLRTPALHGGFPQWSSAWQGHHSTRPSGTARDPGNRCRRAVDLLTLGLYSEPPSASDTKVSP